MVRIRTTNNSDCEISLNAETFNSAKISCSENKTELTPKITALDVTSTVENGVLLETAMYLHNNDAKAHKDIISELKAKNLSQDEEIAKKANITSLPTKTSDLTNDSNFATTSQLPTVGNGILSITQNGVTLGTFGANQSENTTVDVSVDLSGKANTNLGNTTSKLADSFLESISPDWANIILVNIPYTCPSCGYFMRDLVNGYLNVSVNGVPFWLTASGQGIYSGNIIPVVKGDVITALSAGGDEIYAYFIPMRGAN